jgi:hypothetical protein
MQRQFRRWAPSTKWRVSKYGPQLIKICSGAAIWDADQPVRMALAIVLFAVAGLLAGRVVRCGDLRRCGALCYRDWAQAQCSRRGTRKLTFDAKGRTFPLTGFKFTSRWPVQWRRGRAQSWTDAADGTLLSKLPNTVRLRTFYQIIKKAGANSASHSWPTVKEFPKNTPPGGLFELLRSQEVR